MLQTVVAVAVVATLPACNDTNFCSVRREELLRADGGSYPCTRSEDCPRPDNALVCLSDNTPIQECVRCEETPSREASEPSCVRVIPEPCP